MKQMMILMLGWVLICGAAAGAGELTIGDYIPADVQWGVYWDKAATYETALGQMILMELDANHAGKEVNAGMVEAWGIEPRSDVHTVTLLGKGKRCDEVIMLWEGNFDTALIKAKLTEKKEYAALTYEGETIYTWQLPGLCNQPGWHAVYGAFLRDDLIAISPGREAMEKIVDTARGRKASLMGRSEVSQLRMMMDGALFVAGAEELQELVSKKGKHAVLLGNAEEVTARVGYEDDTITLNVVMKVSDEQKAEQMMQLMEGMRALALLNAEEEPIQGQLASYCKFYRSGTEVYFTAKAPMELVVEMSETYWDTVIAFLK